MTVENALYYRRLGWNKKFVKHLQQLVAENSPDAAAVTALNDYDEGRLDTHQLIDTLSASQHMELLKLAVWYGCLNDSDVLPLLQRCAELGDNECYIGYLHFCYVQGYEPAVELYRRWQAGADKAFPVSLSSVQALSDVLDERIELTLWKRQLSPIVADFFIALSNQQFQPAAVIDPATGEAKLDDVRRADIVYLSGGELTLLTLLVQWQFSGLLNKSISNAEMLNVIRYRDGQEYRPHYDAFTDKQLSRQVDQSQRDRTAIGYLQVPEQGGETTFPNLEVRVEPEPGSMLSFCNVGADMTINNLSLHAGEPVAAGDKIIITQWFRDSKTDHFSQLIKRK